MTPGELGVVALAMVPGVVIVIELFFKLPIIQCVHTLRKTTTKAFAVISSSGISDHWKEKAVPCYARKMMITSLGITLYLAVLLLTFGIIYSLVGILVFDNLHDLMEQLFRLEMQVIVIAIGLLYGVLRKRLSHG